MSILTRNWRVPKRKMNPPTVLSEGPTQGARPPGPVLRVPPHAVAAGALSGDLILRGGPGEVPLAEFLGKTHQKGTLSAP